MALVLADVGGTNVRFATVPEGAVGPQGTRRYQNDAHASFDDALDTYIAEAALPAVDALSIAVAGPVSAGRARLTNRGWSFDTAELARRHDCPSVHLLNDLSALGYALDRLDDDGLAPVLPGSEASPLADQRLVIGVGTGVNVSPVVGFGDRAICLRAEAGLGSLPSRVARVMESYVAGPAPWVKCAEDALRGPGLAALHAAATHTRPVDARDVIAAAVAGDAAATASVTVYARMLGEMVQDLRLLYMPEGGIFMAGSVVRGLLDSPARNTFIETISAPPTVKSTLDPVPVSLITQDEAALLGCLSYARIMERAA